MSDEQNKLIEQILTELINSHKSNTEATNLCAMFTQILKEKDASFSATMKSLALTIAFVLTNTDLSEEQKVEFVDEFGQTIISIAKDMKEKL